MSEKVLIALITTGGATVGAIIGALINAYATIIVAKNKTAQKRDRQPSSQNTTPVKKQKIHWLWGMIGGAIIGAIAVLVFLSFIGIFPPPGPIPSPTSSSNDADPTVYDNFNNTAFDGSYNAGRWGLWEMPASQYERVAQQNGMLVVTRGAKSNSWAPIGARNDFTINKPTFFEAKLMMEASKPPESHTFIALYPHFDLPSRDYTDCVMRGDGSSKQAEVLCNYFDKGEYISGGTKLVNYGEWHTVRIEVEPSRMMFTYYIDGKVINSYLPSTAEELKKVKFSFAIGVSGETDESFTGYIDDVRIGQ